MRAISRRGPRRGRRRRPSQADSVAGSHRTPTRYPQGLLSDTPESDDKSPRLRLDAGRRREVAQILRFLVIGSINTLVSLALYWGLLYVGVIYPIASALGAIVGILVSFKTQGRFVFRTSGVFVWYLLAWSTIYVVNIGSIALMRDRIGDYLAGILLLPVSSALSYVLFRRLVFRPQVSSVEVGEALPGRGRSAS